MENERGLNRIVVGGENFGITGWGCLGVLGLVVLGLFAAADKSKNQATSTQSASTKKQEPNIDVRVPQGEYAVAVQPHYEARYLKSGVHKIPQSCVINRFRARDKQKTTVLVVATKRFEERFDIKLRDPQSRGVTVTVHYELGTTEEAAVQPFRLAKLNTLNECVSELCKQWIYAEPNVGVNGGKGSLETDLANYLTKSARLDNVLVIAQTR